MPEAADTVLCPHCDAANPASHRFCGACGQALTVACAACGRENPAANRFCGGCGKALPSPTPPAPEPEPEPEPAPLPIPAPTPPPIPAPSPLAAGMDALAREREVQSLLAKANLQRMRAQLLDARRTLEIALEVAHTLPAPAASPVHEMMGDMLAAEERWEQARDAYALALDAEPGRAAAERKLGEMLVRASDEEALRKAGGNPLRGDDLIDILRENRAGRRHAGLAMFLSLLGPGFGQLYCGKFVKGAILLAVFAAALLLIAVSPERGDLFQQIAAIFALKPAPRGTSAPPPGLVACAVVAVGVWVYALVDAPITAGRSGGSVPGRPIPMGDRSDWEP